MLLGDGPGRLRVQGVVSANCPDGFGGLLGGVDGKQALAGGEQIGEASCLKDDWPTGRKVAGGTVAEPATASTAVAALDAAELASRPRDVIAVQGGRGNHVGALYPPAVTAEQAEIRVVRVDVQGDLDLLAGQHGQVDELAELLGLRPQDLSFVFQVAITAPIGDRCEAVAGDGSRG